MKIFNNYIYRMIANYNTAQLFNHFCHTRLAYAHDNILGSTLSH